MSAFSITVGLMLFSYLWWFMWFRMNPDTWWHALLCFGGVLLALVLIGYSVYAG